MQRIAVFAIASLVVASSACAQYKSSAPPPAPTVTPVPTASAPAQQPTLESAKRIERNEAIKMVDEHKAVWVDVRPKDQYEIGHIKGAINIPLSDLITRIKDLPPHKYIITYCA